MILAVTAIRDLGIESLLIYNDISVVAATTVPPSYAVGHQDPGLIVGCPFGTYLLC